MSVKLTMSDKLTLDAIRGWVMLREVKRKINEEQGAISNSPNRRKLMPSMLEDLQELLRLTDRYLETVTK